MEISEINFSKMNGLVPAIIQDSITSKVLMQGFMNEDSFIKTQETGLVCFYSRSKNRLWTKGEESGNFLHVNEIFLDCDKDSILIKVKADGPVCHTGQDTCWNEKNMDENFLNYLEKIIHERKNSDPNSSYTASLFAKGINKVAQKVGEEAIELVIEAKDENDNLFLNEAADLLFHYMVLLKYKGFGMNDVINILKERHK